MQTWIEGHYIIQTTLINHTLDNCMLLSVELEFITRKQWNLPDKSLLFYSVSRLELIYYCVGGCRHSPNGKLTAIRNVLVMSRSRSRSAWRHWRCQPKCFLRLWRHELDRCAMIGSSLDSLSKNKVDWQVLVDFGKQKPLFSAPWLLPKLICQGGHNFLPEKTQNLGNADTFCWF